MAVQEKSRWKNWADCLRQEMMTSQTMEVTKSVEAITSETATMKTDRTLKSERFWRGCQAGTSPNDFLATAGFEIEFQQDEKRNVREVTFRLNQTWMTILRRALDRKKT
jgi:hypothetical protein